MNKKAVELPMNVIIILVLVIFVLAAVGIFFFMQFSKGAGAATTASDTAKAGSGELTSTIDWTSVSGVVKTCKGSITIACSKFYVGPSNNGATIPVGANDCKLVGCAGSCFSVGNSKNPPAYNCDTDQFDVCVGPNGYPSELTTCEKITREKPCTDAGCEWK